MTGAFMTRAVAVPWGRRLRAQDRSQPNGTRSGSRFEGVEVRFPGSDEGEDLMQLKQDCTGVDQPKRAQGDAPKERFCLRCKSAFWSEGFGQRICARCKSTSAWRTAVSLGGGEGRRRSGGRSS